MTELTYEAVKSLLDGATPGPWRADGEPWNRVVWSSADNRVCFMAHSSGLNDARDIATSNLIAAAPDLARALLDARAEHAASLIRINAEAVEAVAQARADAQAAVALALEEAAENKEQLEIWAHEILAGLAFADVLKIDSYNDKIEAHDMVGRGLVEVIRALAPADGLALVRELRADVERLNRWRAEEGEKIKRQAKALTDLTKHCQRIEAENAGLARKIGKVQRGDGDHSQIADLEVKVINQRNELANLRARDGRMAELAVERDRLAAANAVLEAKVAGLVDALAGLLCAITDTDQIGDRKLTITGGTEALRWLLDAEDAARATLATQEAGNG